MKRTLIIMTMLLALFAACTNQAGLPAPPLQGNSSTAGNNARGISIQGFAFSEKELTISRGDTVVWTNMDSVPHTVTSDSGSELGSPTLSKGQTYSHTFNTAGTFSYHCSIHPMMTGTITVT